MAGLYIALIYSGHKDTTKMYSNSGGKKKMYCSCLYYISLLRLALCTHLNFPHKAIQSLDFCIVLENGLRGHCGGFSVLDFVKYYSIYPAFLHLVLLIYKNKTFHF